MGERYGVIVGANACGPNARVPALRFAEADAKAIYDRLTDENSGTFDAASVQLLTGSEATTSAVKSALRDIALRMSPSDMLFVYFSGHAIVSPWSRRNDPHLVTSDLNPDSLKSNPDQGLRMSFLRRDVFEVSQGSSFLILDTCHAGAYLDLGRATGPLGGKIMTDALDETREMRLQANCGGLFACASDGAARESAELRHGLLTHYVLLALQGGAANQVGEVTFDAVVDYVRCQDIKPEPGSFAQGWGSSTILVHLGAAKKSSSDNITHTSVHSVATIEPLANPLDIHVSSIQLLLDRFFRSGRAHSDPFADGDVKARLELARYAVDAAGAAEVRIDKGETVAMVGDCGGVLNGPLLDRITKISEKESVLGFTGVQLEDTEMQWLVVLPRQNSGNESALVLTNPAPGFLRAGEPIAVALRSLWEQFPIGDPLAAETQALSSLRSKFGRLPVQIYQKCLDNYSDLINSLVMVFEPIMVLSEVPEMVGINGWEALARRDSTARRAPVDILRIAEAWGDRFVIERDTALAVKAITSYAQAHSQGLWKHDAPKPVSVNVSVRSLLSGAYEDALGQAIADVGIAPHMITLEISERDATEPFPDEETWGPAPIAFFQNRLRELANSLRVNFAIDDFGVGYASLDRVSVLDLTQIKVDRAILHHSMAEKELELVVQLAKEALNKGRSPMPRIVVVEGVDSESPVSLYDLRKLGINYVQGYITGGPARSSLDPLDDEVRRKVASKVRGE